MDVIVLILMFILLFVSILIAYYNSDILSPLLIFITPLYFSYLLYYILYRDEYEISDKTKMLFIVGNFSFVLGYIFFEIIKNKTKTEAVKNQKFIINKNIKQIYMIIAITGFISNIFLCLNYGINGPFKNNFLRNIRYMSNYDNQINFFTKYSVVVLHVITLISWYIYIHQKEKNNYRKRNIVLAFLFLISPLFTMARTGVLQCVLAFIYIINSKNVGIFKKKLSIRKIIMNFFRFSLIFFIIISIFIFFANTTNKMGDKNLFSKEFFVFKYLGYPLIAFDKYILDYPSISKGYNMLGIFGKILSRIGIYDISEFSVVGAPSGEFNVYSYLCGIYMDAGIFGVIFFTFIIGVFTSYIYNKNFIFKGPWTIFYSLYIYSILIAFYAFQFSNSYYIYVIILLLIITKNNKIKISL